RPFKMVISSDLNTDGDMTIPSGRYIIHGHGTASTKFVKKLQKGDTITVTPSWTFNGVSVEPEQIISGKPKILEDGVTLNTASEWSVALDPHPRSAIGYSDNGDKVYCLVVDGRSLLSDGVNTMQLADIMRFAGATEAMNIDGGGSSALYTSALGVRNVPSDGFERADGNAIFCVSSAPDDDEIVEIRFLDFALTAPKFGLYTPKFYGYNQYGMLINADVEGVELSCDESFGTIQNGNTFYATGEGTGLLTATYNGATVSMPLTIVGSVDGISITNDSIINDALRDYKIDVQSKIGETQMPIEPKALTWSCSDETVVQIDKSEGILRGLINGEAIVIGKIGDVSDTMKVVVQMPEAREMHIDPNLDISTWKITQSGGKIVEAVGHGNGFTYTYTGASSRNPKIVFAKDFILWSLPDTIRVRLNPGEAPLKNVVFGTRANGSNITYTTITPQSIEPNTDLIVDLPTSLWTDADFMGNYPIKMQNIQLNMGTSITDQRYTIKVNDITTVYRLMPPDEPKPRLGDLNGDNVIDVKDVTALISYILGDTPDWLVFDNANVNGEGDVDVQDVTALITKVLE
ncbi:MAG: phosphodiester glycosidase family protein, partial [Muribaculaceae bacterium]|nr:phosphodiester glycosidase family protein [Muribaculaceae bacterium]